MDHQNSNPEKNDTKQYSLYEDQTLLGTAESDPSLYNLLRGLKQAEKLAIQQPDNPGYKTVAEAAEESTRDWIKRKGYVTDEGQPEFPPEPPGPINPKTIY